MKQNLTIPARCVKCEELFDMSYDLKEYSNEDLKKTLSKKKEILCWECRNV